jgi:hypothetical protein
MPIVGIRQSTTSLPAAPITGDFTNVQQFRTELAKWAGEELKSYQKYIESFAAAVSANEIPDIVTPRVEFGLDPGYHNTEGLIRLDYQALSDNIADKADQIIDTLISVAERDLANTRRINVDVDNLVSLVERAFEKELDSTNPLSIYAFRTILKNFINTLLLDSSFQILATDLTAVDKTVTAFINRSKSTLDDELFLVERRNLNDLALDGVLDSSIASEAISRISARKGRQFIEIENQAEELKRKLTNDAFERQYEKQRIRISALTNAPYNLPPAAFGILGSLFDKIFPDPNSFLSALPNLLSTAAKGYDDLLAYWTKVRFKETDTDIATVQAYTEYQKFISENLIGIYQALAKMSTFEAS